MSDEKFHDFNLVGGTALALKIGHRMSIDIDLFSVQPFDAPLLASHLSAAHQAVEVRTLTNGVFCFIDNIKVDLISHQYPLVGAVELAEGIRMVSLLDIGAMKLNAIYNNGTRLKDFVDLYALLEVYTLSQLLEACRHKYPDLNLGIVKKATVHFEDIDFSTPIHYIDQEIKWPVIAARLNRAYQDMHVRFGLPDTVRAMLEKGRAVKKGKNRGRKM
ncbi:MAG TPA: nucleotidyl transferase AbiEii/AbiGii toxin family protein [Puia sp.]|nr:nucleotidyl transferase AbiEii/AbiGii toxin family protein [Puia sp.]